MNTLHLLHTVATTIETWAAALPRLISSGLFSLLPAIGTLPPPALLELVETVCHCLKRALTAFPIELLTNCWEAWPGTLCVQQEYGGECLTPSATRNNDHTDRLQSLAVLLSADTLDTSVTLVGVWMPITGEMVQLTMLATLASFLFARVLQGRQTKSAGQPKNAPS